MARLARVEAFAPDEIAAVHVMNRVVRRCFLMGTDEHSGKNYDYRKVWVENELKRLAAGFGIDLLAFAIMSNHFHLILRSRPDVVESWDDTEVARRWLWLCPFRKADGQAAEPSEPELNSIRLDADKVKTIRSRLSDISWWMRLLSQKIAQRANSEDQMSGKFWQSRYKAVRLIDEEALLACAAYVDLNPIRAALSESIEHSCFTSARLRLQAIGQGVDHTGSSNLDSTPPGRIESASPERSGDKVEAACDRSDSGSEGKRPALPRFSETTSRSVAVDGFLVPIEIDQRNDPLGPQSSWNHQRCSDKGFLAMTTGSYLELLDWTASQIVKSRRGTIPSDEPKLFERLRIRPAVWCELVTRFGKLFSVVAGQPHRVDDYRSRLRKKRYYLRQAARELLAV